MNNRRLNYEQAHRRKRALADVRNLVIGALILLVIGCVAIALAGEAQGFTTVDGPDCYCMIRATATGVGGYDPQFRGTGMLVADGVVLSCSHIFRGSPGPFSVEFAQGRVVQAEILARDDTGEKVLLKIPSGVGVPVAVNPGALNPPLHAGGFGNEPAGAWRWISGNTMGATDAWLTFTGERACERGTCYKLPDNANLTRQGDSGGPVLNAAGELVGVAWGTTGRTVYFCGGEPLKRFLDRHLPRRPAAIIGHARPPRPVPSVYQPQPAAPTGQPVQQPAGGEPALPSTYTGDQPGPAAGPATLDTEWIRRVDENIDELGRTKQDKGEYLTAAGLEGYAKAADVVSLTEFDKSMGDIKTDIHGEEGAVSVAINARVQGLLKNVGDVAGEIIVKKLKPLDEKVAALEGDVKGRLLLGAASVFGVTIPAPVLAAGSLLGGPIGLAAAGLVWWRVSKRLKKPSGQAAPGSGGAGGGSGFH